MANLKAGTTIGGHLVFHSGNFNNSNTTLIGSELSIADGMISIKSIDASRLSSHFANTTTHQNIIYFTAATGSSDPGFIVHETAAGDDANKGVIHICPSDDSSIDDYVSIHGTNDPENLILRTDGSAYFASKIGINTKTPTAMISISNITGDNTNLLSFSEGDTNEFVFKGYFAGSGNTGNKLVLATDVWSNNIMSWRGDGNVGIGTIDPYYKLHVKTGTIVSESSDFTGNGFWSIDTQYGTDQNHRSYINSLNFHTSRWDGGSYSNNWTFVNDNTYFKLKYGRKTNGDYATVGSDIFTFDGANKRFGIYNTSPAYNLDVTGNARITTDLQVDDTINIGSTLSGFSGTYAFVVSHANGGIILDRIGNPAFLRITQDNDNAKGGQIRSTTNGLSFTNGDSTTTYMTINNSGLGIGTTSPSQKLDVNGSIKGTSIYLNSTIHLQDGADGMSKSYYDDATYEHRIYPADNNSQSQSVPLKLMLYYNGVYREVWHSGNDGSGSGLDADTVDGIQAGSFIRSDAADYFSGTLTYTPDTGTILKLDSKDAIKRYTANGGLGIGADDCLILGAGESRYQIESNVSLSAESVYVGGESGIFMYVPTNNWDSWSNKHTFTLESDGDLTWSGTGTATDWVATSDRKLKENIKYLNSELDKVVETGKLAVEYNLKSDKDKRKQLGFIAQDIEDIYPEFVFETKDAESEEITKAINYSKMVAPLYKAISELKEIVDKQQETINKQQELIDKLLSKL